MIEKTNYQIAIETHYNALLGIFRHFITQFADESVEIAARAVALAAPLPNAINMYNVAVRDLGYGSFASFAFALTLEIVVFLLVEIALKMWDGYLVKPGRFRYPFHVSIGIVLVATSVVIGIVYVLEPHKIMALLPVVSLCSFVGIGLKRWDERNEVGGEKSVKSSVKQTVKQSEKQSEKSLQETVKLDLTTRQVELLKLLSDLDGKPAESVNKSELARQLKVSRPTLNKEFDILQSSGKVALNGHVEILQK